MTENSTANNLRTNHELSEDDLNGTREESFEELMRDLCDGSEDAAWKVVERYTPHILRVIRASLPKEIRSKVDSIDIANTLLGSLLIKRTYLSNIREPAQLLALLTKAARNRVIDEHRKYTTYASRDIRSEEGAFGDHERAGVGVAGDGRYGGREQTPSEVAIAREKWRCLVESLSVRDRRIVSLRIKGLTYEQIASQMKGVSARTARRVLANAIDRLCL